MSLDQKPQLYRYIPVWRRHEEGASLYRVVEVLGIGFVVQSRDYVCPDTPQEQILQLDRQFEELIFEMPPERRMSPQPSIQEAVADFDRQVQDGPNNSFKPNPLRGSA